jgi:hypothetical protein
MEDAGRPDFFNRLMGNWQFEREITGQGTMVGVAFFELLTADRAEYRETGTLTLIDGKTLRAERRYIYERATAGFAVYFADTDELFHHVELETGIGGGWRGVARHLCKADVYDSEYWFQRDGPLQIRHEVRGPKKDYGIRTIYRRP